MSEPPRVNPGLGELPKDLKWTERKSFRQRRKRWISIKIRLPICPPWHSNPRNSFNSAAKTTQKLLDGQVGGLKSVETSYGRSVGTKSFGYEGIGQQNKNWGGLPCPYPIHPHSQSYGASSWLPLISSFFFCFFLFFFPIFSETCQSGWSYPPHMSILKSRAFRPLVHLWMCFWWVVETILAHYDVVHQTFS